jgi:hypothetical protein
MAQLGQKPHGFKDLDFLTVLKKKAVTFGADWKPWHLKGMTVLIDGDGIQTG